MVIAHGFGCSPTADSALVSLELRHLYEEPLRWKIGPFARAFPPGAPLRRGGVVAQAAGPRGAAQARRGAPVVRFAALALSTPHLAAAPLD